MATTQIFDQSISLANLTVSSSAKNLLRAAGFRTLNDVLQSKPMQLSRDLNMKPETTLQLIKEIKHAAGFGKKIKTDCLEEKVKNGILDTAVQFGFYQNASYAGMSAPVTAFGMLLEKERSQQHIVTFCQAFDKMVGGGIPAGEITEICGSPGAGKTQLCTQLAVDVCIPEAFGGIGGEALYVDTEGSFDYYRVKDMAKALLKHLNRNMKQTHHRDPSFALKQKEAVDELGDVNKILQRIHYCRVHNYTEQMAFINSVNSILKKNKKIRLLIIDSVAFHFRHDFENMAKRTRLLSSHAQTMNLLANQYSLAVVVTNQMTTKIQHGDRGKTHEGASYLVPALGESWSHAITSRIVLSVTQKTCSINFKTKRRCNNSNDSKEIYETVTEDVTIRQASLVKSPSRQQQTIEYIVVQAGVRSVPNQSKRPASNSSGRTSDDKRIRRAIPTRGLSSSNSPVSLQRLKGKGIARIFTRHDLSNRLRNTYPKTELFVCRARATGTDS